ncbi:unnamed protein product, partial [Prorocentrum cordatum]
SLMELSVPEGGPRFALFDLHRPKESEVPEVALAPLAPPEALLALAERPSRALVEGGRGGASRFGLVRFESMEKLQETVKTILLEYTPGWHLRLQDDEDIVKMLISYHPEGDRLLDDMVAVKVDSSPIDDNTRCFWVVKYDGYEEDISIRECLRGFENYLRLEGVEGTEAPAVRRLGPGRWNRGLRETTFERSRIEEEMGRENYEKRDGKFQPRLDESLAKSRIRLDVDPKKKTKSGKPRRIAPRMPWDARGGLP